MRPILLAVANGGRDGLVDAAALMEKIVDSQPSLPVLRKLLTAHHEAVRPPVAAGPEQEPIDRLAGLHHRDRAALIDVSDDRSELWPGQRSPADVLRIAQTNNETIEQTTARLTRLGRRFPVSAPDFDWGAMWTVQLPSDLRAQPAQTARIVFYESVPHPGSVLIHLAGRTDTMLSSVVRTYASFLAMCERPAVADESHHQLRFVPDEVDVVVAMPTDLASRTARLRKAGHRWDALHVVRVAARLGMPIGDIAHRVCRLAPLLDDPAAEVPAEAAAIVPDWRDVILLTPGLDGQRLITGDDLTDAWIRLAALEADTTEDDVRWRLGRYAAWCGFTAPTIE
jgi:hypothetical protein